MAEIPVFGSDGFISGTRKAFNPVSLVYLFSCIPSLAFGSLFTAVARIGDDLRAVRASQGCNSEPTTGATPAKEDDNSTTLLIIAGVITVLAVVFIAVSGVFK
jgi:hypothetical protein